MHSQSLNLLQVIISVISEDTVKNSGDVLKGCIICNIQFFPDGVSFLDYKAILSFHSSILCMFNNAYLLYDIFIYLIYMIIQSALEFTATYYTILSFI